MLTPTQRDEIDAILIGVLQQNPNGISEYDLLQVVASHPAFGSIKEEGNLGLFKRHFLLKHCLFVLKDKLWQQNHSVIDVGPLLIQLKLISDDENNIKELGIAESQAVSDYYKDWDNFNTNVESVDELLSNFWLAYSRYLSKDEAWQILDLNVGSTLQQITRRYRELAAKHHPDKGGDQQTFIRIRSAYEVLKAEIN